LGRLDYGEALRLQEEVREARIRGGVGDVLILLEHPPVFTIGLGGSARNILVDREVLRREGVEVFEVDRGGM
jgi:lipoate-protein ligase B